MTTKRKLQVFISSTYRDLKTERQAAVEAILKAGHIPAGMELFSAGSESQMETIRRWIDESDIYMLILGGRYGTVEPKTALSYTELEYDYAISQKKPIFAVVITESSLDEKVRLDGRDALETDSPKELNLFRKKVLTRISSFFSDTKDIKLAVHETLADFQLRHKFVGWISGSGGPDVSALLEEIARLRAERDEAVAQMETAKAALEKQASRPLSKWQDDEFKQIRDALAAIEITTKVFNKDDSEPAMKVPVLRIFDVMRDLLITGVTNQSGIDDLQQLLYFNVCPKLEVHELAALERVMNFEIERLHFQASGS
ncbi:DUF4062 domain-containing protein [Xanthomonas campestris pv. incanae]|uniref:DUF4062 domain-containing protein n=1 Tax=Xanthomonas campestris TaxID=339 RepID=UPI003F4CE88F